MLDGRITGWNLDCQEKHQQPQTQLSECTRTLLERKATTKLDSVLRSKDKGPYSLSCGFFSSHAQMWQLDHKEGLAPKNQYFQIVMLEKTLESPLDYKEIQPVNPKGNQSWILIGRTDAEAPTLWPPDAKNWLMGKDPDEILKVGREGDDRGWDGWLASPTQWIWVWASFGSW